METNQKDSSKPILWAIAAYFMLCGGTAITYPTIWLLAAGLETTITPQLDLTFDVLGVYLLTLTYAAARAAFAPQRNVGVIAVLIVANAIDFAMTLKAIVTQALPALNGGLFIAVAIMWVTLLTPVYFRARTS